jgi:outer membrane protein assembly factor BamB
MTSAILSLLVGCAMIQADDPARDPAEAVQAIAGAVVPPTNGDWPAFRGPHRNAISTEADWQSTWPADGPKRLWTADVGLGYSTVAVAAGKAYTLGHRDGRETVYCFDAATGREVWKHTYEAAIIDNLHLGGPGATPTVDGDRVFTVGKEGHFHCFDAATGAVRWLVHFAKDLNVRTPEWGFTSSPLVQGKLVLVDVAGLAAFQRDSGQLAWRAETQRAGYGSPIALEQPNGSTWIAALTNDALTIVRLVDGATVASHPWTSDYTTSASTPVLCGRALFVSTGYGAGCTLLDLVDGRLNVLYRNKEMSNHMCSSVFWNGHLYGIDGNSHNARQCKLVCLDATTGKRKWEQRGFGCGALMLADGKLIIQADDGNLTIARADPSGYEELARTRPFDGHTWTMPTLARGRIYCRGESGELVCLDVAK